MMSSAVWAASAASIGFPIVKQVTTLANIKACPRLMDADVKQEKRKGMEAHG